MNVDVSNNAKSYLSATRESSVSIYSHDSTELDSREEKLQNFSIARNFVSVVEVEVTPCPLRIEIRYWPLVTFGVEVDNNGNWRKI